MYRQYLKTSLDSHDLKVRNKHAPEGLRFCNGICQDYRSSTDFTGKGTNKKAFCRRCRNLFNLGKQQVENEKITLEQFQDNPNIVYGIESKVTQTQQCKVCLQHKLLDQFENNRRKCKACRTLESINRNSKDIDRYIADIDNLKNTLTQLENYVRKIPKDKLIRIISHFKVGRKSSDTKDIMVYNIVNHFKNLQNPKLCRGGCGYELVDDFQTCKDCQKMNERPNKAPDLIAFQEKIPKLLKRLDRIDHYNQYNYKQLMMINKALGLPSKSKPKKELIESINLTLEKQGKILIENKQLVLNMNNIDIREEDKYINATQLCKAGNKEFKDWFRLVHTKNFLNVLSKSIKVSTEMLVQSISTGPNSHRGTWIHPQVVTNIAQWISPEFNIQVSQWIHKLLYEGTVNLHKKKLEWQQQKFKQLERKHHQLLKKRSYHKFKKGPVFYIISDMDSQSTKYKVGIEGEDINVRLQQHRTSIPATRLEYLVYTNKNKIIEDCMLKRYSQFRKPYLNHEWIYDMELSHLIQSVETVIHFLDLDHEIEEDLDKYNKDIFTNVEP